MGHHQIEHFSNSYGGGKAPAGRPHAIITCECGDTIKVPCTASGGDGEAKRKAQYAGWSIVKKAIRCPKCEQNRKVTPMKPAPEKPEAQKDAPKEVPNEPSRKQKREIMDMLEEVYNTEAETYRGNDTDASVADVLGVMPGWVAKLREEFFGPAGGNEEIASLMEDIKAWREDAKEKRQAAITALEELEKCRAKISAFEARLDRINKAVGAHVHRKIGSAA